MYKYVAAVRRSNPDQVDVVNLSTGETVMRLEYKPGYMSLVAESLGLSHLCTYDLHNEVLYMEARY